MFAKFFSKKNHGNCTICLEEITNNCKKTQCNHKFHKQCINQWIKEKNICPLCRKENPIKRKLTRKDHMDERLAIRAQQRRERIRNIINDDINQGFEYNIRFVPNDLLYIIKNYLNAIKDIESINFNNELEYINQLISVHTYLFRRNTRDASSYEYIIRISSNIRNTLEQRLINQV